MNPILFYLEQHLNINTMVFYFLLSSMRRNISPTIRHFPSLRSLIGKEECAPPMTIEPASKSKPKLAIFALFYQYLARVKRWHWIQNRNQPVCKHRYHCLIHSLLV